MGCSLHNLQNPDQEEICESRYAHFTIIWSYLGF